MLFALFGKRPKPRGWSYVPRFYDPETDKDRTERMRFDQGVWSRKHGRVHRGMNPFVMAMMAVIVAVLIYTLHQGRSEVTSVPDIQLTPSDVPAHVEQATPNETTKDTTP
ncbi:hypothetical protein KQI63_03315 [bacterium]|nr:hypothetical protein [bacterium]